VADGPDRCPQTPAGAVVDQHGCPRDSDADRVYDGLDRCPDTAPGAAVGADGCPAVALFTPARTSVELRGVSFETGKARLLPQSTEVLDEVVAALLANPQWRVEVAGYTDNTGSAATNRRLSLARAEAVRAYLVQHGVPASRLVARGYGPADPVASNATAGGRARNRRVELHQLE
jgi:OOP family OmpA-OmpF porin